MINWHKVPLAILVATVMPGALSGAAADEWHELAQGCEAVILEQSFAPFEDHEPAPFASGKPGEKQFAAYSASRELVAIARVVGDGEWEQCLVRESEEGLRARTLAAKWVEGLAVAFPKSDYIWVNGLTPDYANPGMLRCDSGTYVLSVRGYFGRDYVNRYNHRTRSARDHGKMFRVFVIKEPSERIDELCRQRGSG